MILDEQALFSDAQAITETAVSTNVIKVNGDIGKGEPVEVLAQVVEDFEGLTDITVAVQTCDTEAGEYEDLVTTGAIELEKLKAGYKFPLKFLPIGIKKYLRLNYTVSGSASAGKITAGIVDGSNEGYHV